ncbi:hypothetical protein [Meiothermus taiwanensis]|uniref:hypothetical protein n=1 Tax=Meiothermus taiwanensis TaxID=172827 RepID=UPI003611418B
MLTAKAQSYKYKRGKYRVPEVAKAAGPQQMGATGDGSYLTLFGRNWAAILNKKTQQVELYGETPTGWEQVPIPPIAHPTRECRHLALAFDQSARHVFAYEVGEQIFIRQWDALLGEFVYRGPFVGVDPVLINDAEVNYFVPDSDVLLLYLTPDRKSLKMRVQRQLYAIEHHIESYATPKTLDILAPLGYQWQAEGDGLNVRSEMYPVYISEMAASGAVSPPTTWDYIPIVLIQNLNEIAASGAVSPPTTWNYPLVVMVYNGGVDVAASASVSAPVQWNYYV